MSTQVSTRTRPRLEDADLFSAAHQRRLDGLRARRRAALAQWQALTPGERAASDALAEAERLGVADHAAARATASLLGASGPAG